MSSTLSDHLISGENATDAVECAAGATRSLENAAGSPENKVAGQPTESSMPAESAESSHRDYCPACEEQFAELQSRISQIERRLEELLAAERNDFGQSADSETVAAGDDDNSYPSEAHEENVTEIASDSAEVVEAPAYTAHLVGDDVQTPPPSIAGEGSDPADLPTWAEAYQSDDVDESVRDYVEQLLQRMGAEGGEKPRPSEASPVTSCGENPRETPRLPQEADGPAEVKTGEPSECNLPVRESSRPATPKMPETSEPESLMEAYSAVGNTQPTVEAIAPPTLEPPESARDSDDDSAGDSDGDSEDASSGYASVESYSPRSLPPERRANLDELRELANISATAAIRTFEKGRAAKNAFDRAPLIMVGLSCGLFLLYFATTCDSQMMQLLLYAGVGLSFLAATVAAGQAMSVLFCWLTAAKQSRTPVVDASDAPDDRSTDGF